MAQPSATAPSSEDDVGSASGRRAPPARARVHPSFAGGDTVKSSGDYLAGLSLFRQVETDAYTNVRRRARSDCVGRNDAEVPAASTAWLYGPTRW